MDNFVQRHGETSHAVVDGAWHGRATDGSTFRAALPFGRAYHGTAAVTEFAAAAEPPPDWGLLLVRKGGFAVARVHGAETIAVKVGRRHVQGRSKAGGQSQQRFARRRDNQARDAYRAAADHAGRLLAEAPLIVVGGDRDGLREVLHLVPGLSDRVVGERLEVAEPRRQALMDAITDAGSVRMTVVNA